MTHPARTRYADDWIISRTKVFGAAIGIGFSLERFYFISPSLHYKVCFYAPEVSGGAEIGLDFGDALSLITDRLNATVSSDYRRGNDTWRVLRPFPLLDMAGGSLFLGSIGVDAIVFDTGGETLKMRDNRGISVADMKAVAAALRPVGRP